MKQKTLPLMLKNLAKEKPNLVVQYYKDENKEFTPIKYSEAYQKVLQLASGLLQIGCKRGDKIGLIADNRPEWLHSNFAIMGIGAIDVPRGCDATEQDLIYILSFAGCKTVIVENENQVRKIIKNKASFPELKQLIVIDDFDFGIVENSTIELIAYNQLVEIGKDVFDKTQPEVEIEKGKSDDLATIIFTSGTTGIPKGVMLTHGNFLAQIDELVGRLGFKEGHIALSVLPVWHSFERACEYIILSQGGTIAYSKPIASVLLADLEKINPHVFPSVPRIWEGVYDAIIKMMKKKGGITNAIFRSSLAVGSMWKTNQLKLIGRTPKFKKSQYITDPLTGLIPTILLYPLYKLGDLLVFKKIRKKMGKNFSKVGGVSGGGALPKNVDMFFLTAGINLLEGYGITEMSPVVSVRTNAKPIVGTVGKPIACLETKIVDKNGNPVKLGEVGAIMFKGPTVMSGYYNNPEKTAEVLSSDGWLDTGDLGRQTLDGEIIITGRKKDTIVLRGGENLEPIPIEMKLQESQYIKLATILGQDQRYLGALILVDEVSLNLWAQKNGFSNMPVDELIETPEVQKLYESEIATLISAHNGFKLFERVYKFKLLNETFEQGKQLSAKGEVMRHKLNKLYAKEIAELFENK